MSATQNGEPPLGIRRETNRTPLYGADSIKNLGPQLKYPAVCFDSVPYLVSGVLTPEPPPPKPPPKPPQTQPPPPKPKATPKAPPKPAPHSEKPRKKKKDFRRIRASLSFFESVTPKSGGSREPPTATAAATTGPAQGPRPACEGREVGGGGAFLEGRNPLRTEKSNGMSRLPCKANKRYGFNHGFKVVQDLVHSMATSGFFPCHELHEPRRFHGSSRTDPFGRLGSIHRGSLEGVSSFFDQGVPCPSHLQGPGPRNQLGQEAFPRRSHLPDVGVSKSLNPGGWGIHFIRASE